MSEGGGGASFARKRGLAFRLTRSPLHTEGASGRTDVGSRHPVHGHAHREHTAFSPCAHVGTMSMPIEGAQAIRSAVAKPPSTRDVGLALVSTRGLALQATCAPTASNWSTRR